MYYLVSLSSPATMVYVCRSFCRQNCPITANILTANAPEGLKLSTQNYNY